MPCGVVWNSHAPLLLPSAYKMECFVQFFACFSAFFRSLRCKKLHKTRILYNFQTPSEAGTQPPPAMVKFGGGRFFCPTPVGRLRLRSRRIFPFGVASTAPGAVRFLLRGSDSRRGHRRGWFPLPPPPWPVHGPLRGGYCFLRPSVLYRQSFLLHCITIPCGCQELTKRRQQSFRKPSANLCVKSGGKHLPPSSNRHKYK